MNEKHFGDLKIKGQSMKDYLDGQSVRIQGGSRNGTYYELPLSTFIDAKSQESCTGALVEKMDNITYDSETEGGKKIETIVTAFKRRLEKPVRLKGEVKAKNSRTQNEESEQDLSILFGGVRRSGIVESGKLVEGEGQDAIYELEDPSVLGLIEVLDAIKDDILEAIKIKAGGRGSEVDDILREAGL